MQISRITYTPSSGVGYLQAFFLFFARWKHSYLFLCFFFPATVSGPYKEAWLWRYGRVRTFKATLLLWLYLLEWPRHTDTPQAHPLLARHVWGRWGLLWKCKISCCCPDAAVISHGKPWANLNLQLYLLSPVSVRWSPEPVQQHAGGTVKLVTLPVAARVDTPAEVQQQHWAVHPRHRQQLFRAGLAVHWRGEATIAR